MIQILSTLQNLLGTYIAPAVLTALASALGLVLLDAILGILVSIKNRTFQFKLLPQFRETSFIPYVGGLLILALFSSYPQIETVFFSVTAAIGLKFIADIGTKIAQLFGGIDLQIQSPITVKKEDAQAQVSTVSPQTGVSTDTPAADKIVPADDSPAQLDPAAQPATQTQTV